MAVPLAQRLGATEPQCVPVAEDTGDIGQYRCSAQRRGIEAGLKKPASSCRFDQPKTMLADHVYMAVQIGQRGAGIDRLRMRRCVGKREMLAVPHIQASACTHPQAPGCVLMQRRDETATQAVGRADALKRMAVETEQAVLGADIDETVAVLQQAIVFQAAQTLGLGEAGEADGLGIDVHGSRQHDQADDEQVPSSSVAHDPSGQDHPVTRSCVQCCLAPCRPHYLYPSDNAPQSRGLDNNSAGFWQPGAMADVRCRP